MESHMINNSPVIAHPTMCESLLSIRPTEWLTISEREKTEEIVSESRTHHICSPPCYQTTHRYICPCFSWPSSSPLAACHHLAQTPPSLLPSAAHWCLGPSHSHLQKWPLADFNLFKTVPPAMQTNTDASWGRIQSKHVSLPNCQKELVLHLA